MVSIIGAVYIGIPKLWKDGKVNIVYKKGLANFRPICLLNTMYTFYSRV